MKLLLAALLAGALTTSAALAAPPVTYSTGAGQPSDNATYLAQERATRNSNGGDREHGGLGAAQADYIHSLPDGQNYGQDVIKAQGWTDKP